MNLEEKKYSKVSCYDFEIDGNNVFLCDSGKNAIYMIDMETEKGRVIGHFPTKGFLSKNLSWSMKRVGNNVVFVPFSANHIGVYNLDTNTFSFYEIPIASKIGKIRYLDEQKFISVFQYRNRCILLGRTYPGIIIIDIQSGSITVFDDFLKKVEDDLSIQNSAYFAEGYAQVGNDVYLGFTCCNSLIKINLDTFEYSLIPIECDFEGIGGICLVDNAIWITDFSQKGEIIIKFDINTGETCKVKMPISDRLLSPLRQKNILYFFPFTDIKKMICYDTISGEWDLLKEINSQFSDDMGRISAANIVENDIVGVFDISKKWFKIQDKNISLFDLYIDTEGFLSCLQETGGNIIEEDNDVDFSLFLKLMTDSEK